MIHFTSVGMSAMCLRAVSLKRCAAIILMATCVGAATAAIRATAQTAYLSDADLHRMIIGKTFSSKSKSGKTYSMYLGIDGTGLMVFANGAVKDPVTWDIKDSVICFHGKLSGDECDKVRAVEGKYEFMSSANGVLSNIYTPN